LPGAATCSAELYSNGSHRVGKPRNVVKQTSQNLQVRLERPRIDAVIRELVAVRTKPNRGRPNSENSKAKPIAAHLKSCGIWEKFGRAVEKNSKQISESANEETPVPCSSPRVLS
jgi:hypothetical protein